MQRLFAISCPIIHLMFRQMSGLGSCGAFSVTMRANVSDDETHFPNGFVIIDLVVNMAAKNNQGIFLCRLQTT
jgi:hypothetical protein